MSNETLRITELFSGAGMQRRGFELASKKIGAWVPELVQTCEMDIDPIISYAAIHCNLTNEMVVSYADYPSREEMANYLKSMRIGYDFKKGKEYNWDKKIRSKAMDLEKVWLACKLSNNLGDIMKVERIAPTDMLVFSFPCTDISVAGEQKGISSGEANEGGTRSGLVYEVLRLLWTAKEDNVLPKYLLMENVDALINKKHLPAYQKINEELEQIGYNAYYDLMNTKNYSYPEVPTPQNRNRCYCMYIRKDIDTTNFSFPKKFDSGIRLIDILEDDADESLYITNPKAQQLIDTLILNGTLTEEDLDEAEGENE